MERSTDRRLIPRHIGLHAERRSRALKLFTVTFPVICLSLSVVLGAYVWRVAPQLADAANVLVHQELASLTQVTDAQLAANDLKELLPDYVQSGDRNTYRSRFAALDARIAMALDDMANSELPDDYARYRRAAEGLDSALTLGASPGSLQIQQLLITAREPLQSLETGLAAEQKERLARVASVKATVARDAVRVRNALLVAAIGVIAALLIGNWFWRMLRRDADARLHLAMFPERNPHPVLRLSAKGDLEYLNAGARALLVRLGGTEAARPVCLLPPKLDVLLDEIRANPLPIRTVEYDVGAFRIEANMHYLSDLDAVHVYLHDISDRRNAEERLIHEAYHDSLTGLPNRRRFDESIGDVLYGRTRRGMRVALLVVGLDRLKNVVESLGHVVLDQVLGEVGARLTRIAHEANNGVTAAETYRFDGGQFVMLIPGYTESDQPIRLAERVREALALPNYVQGREIVVTASIGVAVYPLDGQDGATILKNANTAMQDAKDDGGDRVRCYTHDMNVHANEIFALEHHLRHALELNELELVYQPQFEIRTNRLVGVEALLRWRHPDRGLIAPARFIPLAEETGLILPIGDWTLRRAVAALRACRDAGLHDLVVAINVSGRQLREQNFAQDVSQIVREAGVPASSIELEITESVAMHDVEETIALFDQIKALGVRIAVDDFGTGFSSLSYLTRFPVDRLKVDQSFARHVTDHHEDAAVARAVTELGHSLGLTVIAEGVETAAQLAFFQRTSCDEYQGFYGAVPMSVDEIVCRYRPDSARVAV